MSPHRRNLLCYALLLLGLLALPLQAEPQLSTRKGKIEIELTTRDVSGDAKAKGQAEAKGPVLSTRTNPLSGGVANPTKPIMTGTPGSRTKWNIISIQGVEYVKLSDLCAFYRFERLRNTGKPGCITYGSQNRQISFRPGKQDFYVNNYRYILSFPVREMGGEHMISTVDIRKLVDPVLRPRYSANAGTVHTVVIDAGHGAHDAGAVGRYGREKDINLQLARRLRDRLQKRGFKVVMTRDSDVFLTLQQRVRIANSVPNSIFVSIHHNSGGPAAQGIETFTLAPHGTTSPFARTRTQSELAGNNQDSENIALATAIHSRCIKVTNAVDRGVQRARFSVLCTIQRPAVLFEGGFVSHSTEGARIAQATYQDALADAICSGIVSYAAIVGGKSPAQPINRRTTIRSGLRGAPKTSVQGSRIR